MANHLAKASLPLTAAQSEIWYASQLDPRNPTFNIGECVAISGPFDVRRFRTAYRQALGECAQLDARLVETGDLPCQTVDVMCEPAVDVIDADGPAAARAWMLDDLSTPVDVHRDPLCRTALLRVQPDTTLWYQRYHQFAVDGFGWSLVARRVAELYHGAQPRPPGTSPFSPLPALLDEEAAFRASRAYAADRDYWLSHMMDAPLATRIASPGHTVLRRTSRLDPSVLDALVRLGERAGVRWTRMLIALMAAYIQRLGGDDDVVVSIPVTARTTAIARTTPARMSNILPLRLRVPASTTVADLARQVSTELADLLTHQRYRGEDLRRDLGGTLTGPRQFGPVVNVVPFDADIHFRQCMVGFENLSTGPVDDLSFGFLRRRSGGDLQLQVEANPATYRWEELDLHHDGVRQLITAAADIDPGEPVEALVVPAPVPARPRPGSEHVTESQGGGMPRTPLETVLVTIWREVLDVDQIGVRDSLPDLGGNSVHLVRIGAAIERTLRVRIPLRTLFEARTVAELAERMTADDLARDRIERAADATIRLLTMEEAHA